jgi:hypothetical protein
MYVHTMCKKLCGKWRNIDLGIRKFYSDSKPA